MLKNHKESKFWIIAFGLFVVVVFPFIPSILNNEIINWGTSTLQFLPWLNYAFDSIFRGEIPLWNPYNGLGAPLLANYQSAIFYPPNWLLIIIYRIWDIHGLALGLTVSIVFHLYFGSLGMSVLLRYLKRTYLSCFLGGMIWVFGGYAISRISFFTMIWSFSWVPWIILSVLVLIAANNKEKIKWGIILSILLSMQMFSGHAQTTYFTLILASLVMLISDKHIIKEKINNLFLLAISIIFSILLSLIQLLPTMEYLRLSQRSQEVGFEYATNFSYWPLRILSTLFGNFWGHPGVTRFFGGGTFWEDNLYIGVFPFILTLMLLIFIIGRRNSDFVENNGYSFIIELIFTAFIAFLFSLGKNFVLYPFFYRYVPTFNMFQAPSRFLMISNFCLAVISAYAFDSWQKSTFNPRKIGLVIITGLAIIISVAVSKVLFQSFPKEIYQSILVGSSLIIAFGGITILKDYTNPKTKQLVLLIFVAICSLDLLVHNFPYGNFMNLQYLDNLVTANSKFTERNIFIDQETEEFLKFNRFYRFDRFQNITSLNNSVPVIIPNTNLISPRYKMLNNFDPFLPARYVTFMDWLNRLENKEMMTILKMIGVTDLIHLDISNVGGFDIEKVNPKEIVQWYECSVVLPADETLDWILYNESSSSNERCLALENQNDEKVLNDNEVWNLPEFKVEQINIQKMSISYSSKTEGWIVIRQFWYPGWIAKLDSKSDLNVERVDYMFQGVFVPDGTHTLIIEYKPVTFTFGFYISIASWIIVLLIGFRSVILNLKRTKFIA